MLEWQLSKRRERERVTFGFTGNHYAGIFVESRSLCFPLSLLFFWHSWLIRTSTNFIFSSVKCKQSTPNLGSTRNYFFAAWSQKSNLIDCVGNKPTNQANVTCFSLSLSLYTGRHSLWFSVWKVEREDREREFGRRRRNLTWEFNEFPEGEFGCRVVWSLIRAELPLVCTVVHSLVLPRCGRKFLLHRDCVKSTDTRTPSVSYWARKKSVQSDVKFFIWRLSVHYKWIMPTFKCWSTLMKIFFSS